MAAERTFYSVLRTGLAIVATEDEAVVEAGVAVVVDEENSNV